MKNSDKLNNYISIKYVADRTGLSTHLIRVWESRYQAVSPERTGSNRRLYSEADVIRLQLLKNVVDTGHSISQVAKLSSDALMRLINRHFAADHKPQSDFQRQSDPSYHLDLALKAVLQLDAEKLEYALTQASVNLTKIKLINEVITPLGKKIGEFWRQGELKIINEHIATPVIRSVLWNLLRSIDICGDAPRIVVATPVNHHHDLGALAIALIARESGWRSSFFGSNLPANEIAAAVKRTNARAVALSITFCLNHLQLVAELQKLRRYLHDDIAVFIGGQSAATIIDSVDGNGVQLLKDLNSLNSALDYLLNSRPIGEIGQ